MRVRVAVLTLRVAKPPPYSGRAVAQRLALVAAIARGLRVLALERVARGVVIERVRDRERRRVVAGVAVLRRLRLAELARVDIVVTALAHARDAAVRRWRRALRVLAMARGTRGARVDAEQRPRR